MYCSKSCAGRAYYERHRVELLSRGRVRSRDFRQNNPGYAKTYREANRERIRTRARLHYENNRDLYRAVAIRWRQAHPDSLRHYREAHAYESKQRLRSQRREKLRAIFGGAVT